MTCGAACHQANDKTRSEGGQEVQQPVSSPNDSAQKVRGSIPDELYERAAEMGDDEFQATFEPIYWYSKETINQRKVKCVSCKASIPKGTAYGWRYFAPLVIANGNRYLCPVCHAQKVQEIKSSTRADRYLNQVKKLLVPPMREFSGDFNARFLRQTQFEHINNYGLRLPPDTAYDFYREVLSALKELPEERLNDYAETSRVVRAVCEKYPKNSSSTF